MDQFEMFDSPGNGGIPSTALTPQARATYKIALIPVAAIKVSARLRELDLATVANLRASMRESGLLQPIGVCLCDTANGQPNYRLRYGAHRLRAWDEEGRRAVQEADAAEAEVWSRIPAMIFPPGMTEAEAQLIEIQENLFRKELTSHHRAAQTTLFMGLMKQRGLVQTADTQRSISLKKEVTGMLPVTSAPVTVTQAAAQALGLADPKSVRNRLELSCRLAQSEGLDLSEKVTPENADPDLLIRIGTFPMRQASKARRAAGTVKRKRSPAASTEADSLASRAATAADPLSVLKTAFNDAPPEAQAEFARWVPNQPGWVTQ